MSDENEKELPEIEFDISSDSRAETFDWSAPNGDGGFIIFPAGVEAWAEANNISLVRVSGRTGAVEYLKELGSKWTAVDKPLKSSVRAIGEATTDS